MSCATRCDRCGEYFDSQKGMKRVVVFVLGSVLISEESRIDLCGGCYAEFAEWMKDGVGR